MPTLTLAEQSSPPAGAPLVVPLAIDGPAATRACQPVTVGIPFPKGALPAAESLALLDAGGQPVPLQVRPLAHWSDGSVKWALLDFLLRPQHGEALQLAVRPAHQGGSGHGAAVVARAEPASGATVIDTGAAVFHVDGRSLLPFGRVLLDGKDVLAAGGSRVVLTDARDRRAVATVTRTEVESEGPVRTTVCLEGAFGGGAPLRFVARVCFFAGTGLVRLRLTVHNPRRALHRGGLWDLGDTGSVLFRDLALEIPLGGAAARPRWAAEPRQQQLEAAADTLEIYQDSSGGPNWQSRNHVNRAGRVACTFQGYRVRDGAREHHGLRASPVLTLGTDAAAVDVAVPEFWQQFPKALEVSGSVLTVRLFPGQCADLFELQGGEQKTHEVWLRFAAPGQPALAWPHQPARVRATPEWYAACGALPFLVPAADDPDPRLQELLGGAVSGPDSFFARREVVDEYGWRNFGDCYADHEAAYYSGPAPVMSHYNNQYDVVYGTLLQYFRTGDGSWLSLSEPLARHFLDIDLYHTDRDRPAYNGGAFWHTDHYRDAAASTHRCYARANQPAGKPYGGGPCDEHNYTTGLLHYFYTTGDAAARAAVLGLADWVLGMDDGRRTLFGLVDDGPTGHASSTNGDYHGPGRGCGNSVNALLDGWLVSGRRRYLDGAEALIRRAVHPADDVAARDLLNSELRWSYTVFLTVLARYLDVKAEAGELDRAHAHGRASLLHYAGWMAEHEVPYFDHPEKLEFPTETWAAQEFRKANVLRLAAAHADEPLRARLLRRGAELAERAWADLGRFEWPGTTRALAILFVEGVKDAFFRAGAPPAAPRPPAAFDLGAPENFVPQRRRVLALVKRPRGLLTALMRLGNPRRWLRFLSPARRED
jgi:hypothetical protein